MEELRAKLAGGRIPSGRLRVSVGQFAQCLCQLAALSHASDTFLLTFANKHISYYLIEKVAKAYQPMHEGKSHAHRLDPCSCYFLHCL